VTTEISKSKLEQLRDTAGNHMGPFESETGKTWHPRLKRAKSHYDDHSYDWDELRAFFAKPYAEVEVALPDGTRTAVRIKLSIMWSMGKNHISDLHHTNPEPWIRSRRGRADRDFDRMINDVAYAIHDNAGSEEVTRKCLVTGLYQGGGISAWQFEQDGYWDAVPITDENDAPVLDENGAPMLEVGENDEPKTAFRATSQRVVNRFVPLSQCWLDPDGREWDFCDAKYFVWRYKKPLQELWDNKDGVFDKEGLRMLVGAVTDSYSSRLAADKDHGEETDPSFIDIEVAEVWDKTSLEIIHIPIIAGSIAKFDIGQYSWPKALKKAKRFPFRMIAEDWKPPDKDDKDGIYPVPLFRHAKGLVEDIIRLYELFFEAASKVVDKWVAYEGALKSDSIIDLMSTDSDELILLDPAGVQRSIGMGSGLPAPSEVLQRLDRGGEKLAQALGFANMIQAAKSELHEIFGQGGADRGGVAEGKTATEIVQMTAAKSQRTTDARELIAKAFDDGTELAFMLLQEYQTLPIPYQMTTSAFGEERWAEFEAEQLYGLDLIYNHVTDSSRPKNRALERLERKDFVATFMPFVDSKRQRNMLGAWAAEAHDTNGLILKDLFEDPAPDIAKQLLALRTAIQDGDADPTDPEVAAQMMDLETQLIQSVLSDADIEEVATGEGQGGGGARGAGPKSMTPGQMAAAGAAAGMSNVGA
jgi:hypothetical protein